MLHPVIMATAVRANNFKVVEVLFIPCCDNHMATLFGEPGDLAEGWSEVLVQQMLYRLHEKDRLIRSRGKRRRQRNKCFTTFKAWLSTKLLVYIAHRVVGKITPANVRCSLFQQVADHEAFA